jgi:hypothetical protein
MSISKNLVRSVAVAVGLATLTPLAASAGVWRVDASRCPDLREDRRDMRRDNGWRDRREDRRDSRVVRCPARAWYYVPDRYERRSQYRPPRPSEVYIYDRGRYADGYYRDRNGVMIRLNLNLG